MAIELAMRLTPGGEYLVPVNEYEALHLAELIQIGGVFNVKVSQRRTGKFHNKGMLLFRYLFNMWEPCTETVDGVPVKKDFDSFRNHLTIQAGFFEQVFNPQGGFELKAESLAWSKMDNVRFATVYSRLIDVGLEMLGKSHHMTAIQVDAAVEQLLRGFA